MASSSLTFRLFGQDVTAGRTIHNVGDEADRTAAKIDKLGRGFSPLLTAATALGPALIPALAGATAAAGGLGVAVTSGGAALGVFGAVAKQSFKDIQDNLKAAAKGTEQLTGPIGQATRAYEGLTSAWDAFVQKNQPETFRIMGAGFGILTTAIPKLQPLFNVAAEAVARLEGQLDHFVSGGGLDHLVGFLSSNARPALEAFRQTITNFATGVGALAPQFARFSGGVEVGLVHLSERFAHWAQDTGGFQKFFDYVVGTAPDILSTFKSLAAALVNITQGFAPLGPVSLTFVGAMAKLISILPPSAITAIATGFLGVQGALKLAAAASQLFNRSFGATPIGIAAAALSALIGVFTHHAQAVAESRAQTEQFRTTLDKTTAAITLDTRAMAAHQLQASGALDAARQLGLGLSVITDAAVGNVGAMNEVNQAIHDQTTVTREQLLAGQGDYQQKIKNRDAAATLAKALGITSQQIADAKSKQEQLNAATKPTTVAILSQKEAAAQAHRALEQLSASLLKVAGVNLSAEQTEIQFKNSLDSLSQSVKDNGRSLDINTSKGRANRSAVLDSISAALQHADAVGKQTGSQTKAQQAFQNSIPAIREQARRLGLNKKQVDELIRSIGGLKPKTVDVGVVVKGSSVVLSGSRVSVATGSGTRAIRQTGQADGGIIKSFAAGSEQHIAQVARPGEWRVWAEPETGGEAYIPLSPSKRSRSTSILQSVAGMFGFGLIPQADGAILNGGSIGHLTGAFNTMVNSTAVAVARATVQALISSGRLTAVPSFGGSAAVMAVATAVARALGRPAEAAAWARRIIFESGGNWSAVNRWDSNWLAGHPSVGGAQVIAGTFARYAGAYRNVGPFLYGVSINPFANSYAGARYAISRYGSMAAVDPLVRPRGYRSGLAYVPEDNFPALLHRGERVLTASENRRSTGAATNVFNFNGTFVGGDKYALADLLADLIRKKQRREGVPVTV